MAERLPAERPRAAGRYALALPDEAVGATFNYAGLLPGRAGSPHTQRAYYRWVDTYLADVAGMTPTAGDARLVRMTMLPVPTLLASVNPPHLRSWLGTLRARGMGKQSLDQARSAIVVLADLLAEAGWVDEVLAAALARVRPPKAEAGQRPGRWLSLEEIHLLMNAAPQIARSEPQAARNAVIVTALCTMALRREELSAARWGDLSVQNNRPVLRVHGKGSKTATVDVPRPVLRALDRWRGLVNAAGGPGAAPEGRLVRAVWKGGLVSARGLSADGIWLIVRLASRRAGIGPVAPHDLRRSVAGALHEAGTPIDKISRLLRHSNVAVTERYLNRLPGRNEGAILMSDILGLEGDDWPGFD